MGQGMADRCGKNTFLTVGLMVVKKIPQALIRQKGGGGGRERQQQHGQPELSQKIFWAD